MEPSPNNSHINSISHAMLEKSPPALNCHGHMTFHFIILSLTDGAASRGLCVFLSGLHFMMEPDYPRTYQSCYKYVPRFLTTTREDSNLLE